LNRRISNKEFRMSKGNERQARISARPIDEEFD
jgi:hypothetical protein